MKSLYMETQTSCINAVVMNHDELPCSVSKSYVQFLPGGIPREHKMNGVSMEQVSLFY